MSIDISFNNGSGKIEPGSILEFSYSESATPLEPSDTSGGASQVTFSALELPELKRNGRFVNSRLLINNDVIIEDSLNGTIPATVTKVTSQAGVVSVTADSYLSKMNNTVSAPPVHGTMLDAVNTYCGLAFIEPSFVGTLENDMDQVNVNIPAWTGNLWEKLKAFCASKTVNNKPIEVIYTGDGVTFKYALSSEIKIDDKSSDYSISIDSFDAARNIEIVRTFTEYGQNKVIYEMSNYEPGIDPADKFKASITDSMQVESGQTITKRFKINATLESVKQPVCVETITRVPPAPYAGLTGEYVVVGNDNLPIKPEQWTALGGSLIVKLTETPGEIELVITAPPIDELERVSGGSAFAPYSIGIESSGDGDYPALWIVGTGVFYNQETRTVSTGSGSENPNQSAASVSNEFITTERDFWTKAALAAQKACGPAIDVSVTAPADFNYGEGIGSYFYKDNNKFRVNTANYGISEVTMTATPFAEISDFNQVWAGKTFANFTSTMISGLTNPSSALQFNEFTIIPLMEAQ